MELVAVAVSVHKLCYHLSARGATAAMRSECLLLAIVAR